VLVWEASLVLLPGQLLNQTTNETTLQYSSESEDHHASAGQREGWPHEEKY